MKVIGILFIIIGLVSGLLGMRSYLRDDAYAKASVVVKSSVKWAEVKPNSSGKSTAGIRLMLSYMRDGVMDSFEHNYSQLYSKDEPLPTVEELKAATPHIRYLPKEKRSKNIPDWVMVSSKEKHDGLYGRLGFSWMFKFLVLGIMFIFYSRDKKRNRESFRLQKMTNNISS